jgi:uncharacterized membrane protein (UPF0127 family)
VETARIRNATRGSIVAERAGLALGAWERLVGLLGRSGLDEGDGLWLEPCDSVHMLGMRFPIDVAFLDGEGRVLRTAEPLRPWRATWPVRGARCALELPAVTLRRTGTQAGDQLLREAPCASS